MPDQDPYPYLKFSAFIFLAPYHPYRMKMQAVVSNKWFEVSTMHPSLQCMLVCRARAMCYRCHCLE